PRRARTCRRSPRAPPAAGDSATAPLQPRQQVVGTQVLERLEALPEGADVAGVRVEQLDGLAQPEVAGGPRARPGKMPRQVPVGRPLAQAANGGETGLHLVVGKLREPVVVEPGRCNPDHVLSLAPGEA